MKQEWGKGEITAILAECLRFEHITDAGTLEVNWSKRDGQKNMSIARMYLFVGGRKIFTMEGDKSHRLTDFKDEQALPFLQLGSFVVNHGSENYSRADLRNIGSVLSFLKQCEEMWCERHQIRIGEATLCITGDNHILILVGEKEVQQRTPIGEFLLNYSQGDIKVTQVLLLRRALYLLGAIEASYRQLHNVREDNLFIVYDEEGRISLLLNNRLLYPYSNIRKLFLTLREAGTNFHTIFTKEAQFRRKELASL